MRWRYGPDEWDLRLQGSRWWIRCYEGTSPLGDSPAWIMRDFVGGTLKRRRAWNQPQATRAEALHTPANGECFIPQECGPHFDRSLSRQAAHGAGVSAGSGARRRAQASGWITAERSSSLAVAWVQRTSMHLGGSSRGILDEHPSPREGDTQKGIFGMAAEGFQPRGKGNQRQREPKATGTEGKGNLPPLDVHRSLTLDCSA